MGSHCNYSHQATKDLAVPLLTASIKQWTSTAHYTQGASARSNIHAGCHWNEDKFAIYALHLIISRVMKKDEVEMECSKHIWKKQHVEYFIWGDLYAYKWEDNIQWKLQI